MSFYFEITKITSVSVEEYSYSQSSSASPVVVKPSRDRGMEKDFENSSDLGRADVA